MYIYNIENALYLQHLRFIELIYIYIILLNTNMYHQVRERKKPYNTPWYVVLTKGIHPWWRCKYIIGIRTFTLQIPLAVGLEHTRWLNSNQPRPHPWLSSLHDTYIYIFHVRCFPFFAISPSVYILLHFNFPFKKNLITILKHTMKKLKTHHYACCSLMGRTRRTRNPSWIKNINAGTEFNLNAQNRQCRMACQ